MRCGSLCRESVRNTPQQGYNAVFISFAEYMLGYTHDRWYATRQCLYCVSDCFVCYRRTSYRSRNRDSGSIYPPRYQCRYSRTKTFRYRRYVERRWGQPDCYKLVLL